MTRISTQFADALSSIIKERKIQRVVETGTHDGQGSSFAIGSALKETGGHLYTIESNLGYFAEAKVHLARHGLPVTCHLGLSLREDQIPSAETVWKRMDEASRKGYYVDNLTQFGRDYALSRYMAEMAKPPEGEDGLLRELVWRDPVPQLVVLDSAGCMGIDEWNEVAEFGSSSVHSKTLVALDDVFHIKHGQSLRDAEYRGWKVLWGTQEKFGSVILEAP